MSTRRRIRWIPVVAVAALASAVLINVAAWLGPRRPAGPTPEVLAAELQAAYALRLLHREELAVLEATGSYAAVDQLALRSEDVPYVWCNTQALRREHIYVLQTTLSGRERFIGFALPLREGHHAFAVREDGVILMRCDASQDLTTDGYARELGGGGESWVRLSESPTQSEIRNVHRGGRR